MSELAQRYDHLDALGAGSTGRAFRATRPDGTPVVLKVAHRRELGADLATEFVQAARAASPWMPRVNAVGQLTLDEGRGTARADQHGLPCLELEWRAGSTLRETRPKEATLPMLAAALAHALSDLHDAGLAHGDLKPANILVDGTRLSLLDWGSVDDATSTDVRGATPRYLGRGDRSLGDARARDLLALGVILAELRDERTRRAADPLSRARNLDADDPLGRIVRALLARDPKGRPSVRWVLSTLERSGAIAPPESGAPRYVRAVRARYLRLRSHELGAREASADCAPWLAEVLRAAEAARSLCAATGCVVPQRFAASSAATLNPLDAERRLRWLVSLVGGSAASWGAACAEANEATFARTLCELAELRAPEAWTRTMLEGHGRSAAALPSEGTGVVDASGERVVELALSLSNVPVATPTLDEIAASAHVLPVALVVRAADAARLGGDLARARVLAAASPLGDAVAAEVMRRSGDLEAARIAAERALSFASLRPRAQSTLARLALDAGDVGRAEQLLANPSTAEEHEVAALVAHARRDGVAARQHAQQCRALATSDEQRARAAATLAYVQHPATPGTTCELFALAAEHAARAGAVLEEATYRTGVAAAAVALGDYALADGAAARSILLYEDVLETPSTSARAWLARAATWASLDRPDEAYAAALAARRRADNDARARLYADLAIADACAAGSPIGRDASVRLFIELDAARLDESDQLSVAARVLRHTPERLGPTEPYDAMARARTSADALEWWLARVERILADPGAEEPGARNVLDALSRMFHTDAPCATLGKAMHAGRRLADAIGDGASARLFEHARERAAQKVRTEGHPDLTAASQSAAWLAHAAPDETRAPSVAEGAALQHLVRALAERDDLDALLERVLDRMVHWTGAERGLLLLPTRSGDLRPRATRHFTKRELHNDQLAVSSTLAQRALAAGEPVVAVDAMSELSESHESVHALELRSVLVVPLLARGETVGVVYLDDRLRKAAFGEREVNWATAVAPIAAIAIADARRQGALARALRRAERATERAERNLSRRDLALAAAHANLAAVTSSPAARDRHAAIVGTSASIERLLSLVDRVAATEIPVLIRGESGTGKELVARAVHGQSSRRAAPFITENCGALPETLLESTLFGHVRGAFTGAHRTQVGLFEAADGGTLFLDEVGEMSLALQTKLLRVLEDGVVRPLGSTVARRVDVRVLAATNRDLHALARNGTFREDLLYRLDVVRVDVPSLAERRDDIPLLVRHFLAKHAPERQVRITASALASLVAAPWPGNVRQLENELRRALVMTEGTIDREHLSIAADTLRERDPESLNVRQRIDDLETNLVREALRRTAGNQTKAAELLGLSRFGLHKLLRRLHIPLP